MSVRSAKKKRVRRSGAIEPEVDLGNVLCYADQGSFLGLRALGRQPTLHLTWIYPHPLERAAVLQFARRIAQGLLGRVVQRSALPWGRHRWVASPVPPAVTWRETPVAIEALQATRSDLFDLPIDPEHGPGWRLVVQPLNGGGTALSMLVSHTIADGQACVQALVSAITGQGLAHGLPARSWRWSPWMLVRDSAQSLHSLPAAWRAVNELWRNVHMIKPGKLRPVPPLRHREDTLSDPVVEVPLVCVGMDAGLCEQLAMDRGVASNTLLLAFATRLAFRLGRVDAAGQVKLALPVSNRQPGDRRGNALQPASVVVDPTVCHADLPGLQRQVRRAFADILRNGDGISMLAPLVLYVPRWLVRKMEWHALGADLPVGCSMLGKLPTELGNPVGKGELIQFSALERYTKSALERLEGLLFIVSYRIGDRQIVTVSGYQPDRATTRATLVPVVRAALDDIGLAATVV